MGSQWCNRLPPKDRLRRSQEVTGFGFGTMTRDAPKSEEARRQAAKVLYELEIALWETGLSKLVYDEQKDCFRFEDGKFAFSRRRVNWKLLRERGYAS